MSISIQSLLRVANNNILVKIIQHNLATRVDLHTFDFSARSLHETINGGKRTYSIDQLSSQRYNQKRAPQINFLVHKLIVLFETKELKRESGGRVADL